MDYNQILKETSSVCSSTGTNYCLEWTDTTTTTLNFFDLLILVFIACLPFLVYRLFNRK